MYMCHDVDSSYGEGTTLTLEVDLLTRQPSQEGKTRQDLTSVESFVTSVELSQRFLYKWYPQLLVVSLVCVCVGVGVGVGVCVCVCERE